MHGLWFPVAVLAIGLVALIGAFVTAPRSPRKPHAGLTLDPEPRGPRGIVARLRAWRAR